MAKDSSKRGFKRKCGAGRRALLGGVAAGLLSALMLPRPAGADSPQEAIEQPGSRDDMAFIARAFAMRDAAVASGDQPYGAVLVRKGAIIGQAPSRVVVNGDPTAHAEMEAIRDAARRAGRQALAGAVLYSSSPPCAMCEAAAYWAGVGALVHGRSLSRAGPPQLSRC